MAANGFYSWEDELKKFRDVTDIPYKSPTDFARNVNQLYSDPSLSEEPGDQNMITRAGGKALQGFFAVLNSVGGAVYATASEAAESIGLVEEDDRSFGETYKDALLEGEGFADLFYRIADVGPDELGLWDKVMIEGAGLIGDIALDPTTYATFGAGAVAKTALKSGSKVFATQVAQEVTEEGMGRLAATQLKGRFSDFADDIAEAGDDLDKLDQVITEKIQPAMDESFESLGRAAPDSFSGMSAREFAVERIASIAGDARAVGKPNLVRRVLEEEIGADFVEGGLARVMRDGAYEFTGGIKIGLPGGPGKKITPGGGLTAPVFAAKFDKAIRGQLKLRAGLNTAFKSVIGRSGPDWAAYMTQLNADVAAGKGVDLAKIITKRGHYDTISVLGSFEKANYLGIEASREVMQRADLLVGQAQRSRNQLAAIGANEKLVALVEGSAKRVAVSAGKTLDEAVDIILDAVSKSKSGRELGAAQAIAENREKFANLVRDHRRLRDLDRQIAEDLDIDFRIDFENRTLEPAYREFMSEIKGRSLGKSDFTKERSGVFSSEEIIYGADGQANKIISYDSVAEANEKYLASTGGKQYAEWAVKNGYFDDVRDAKLFIEDELVEVQNRIAQAASVIGSEVQMRELAKVGLVKKGVVGVGADGAQQQLFVERLQKAALNLGTPLTTPIIRELFISVFPPDVAVKLVDDTITDPVLRWNKMLTDDTDLLSPTSIDLNRLITKRGEGSVEEAREILMGAYNESKFLGTGREGNYQRALEELDEVEARLQKLDADLDFDIRRWNSSFSAGGRFHKATHSSKSVDEALKRVRTLMMSGNEADRNMAAKEMYDTVIRPAIEESKYLKSLGTVPQEEVIDAVVRHMDKFRTTELAKVRSELEAFMHANPGDVASAMDTVKDRFFKILRDGYGKDAKGDVVDAEAWAVKMRSEMIGDLKAGRTNSSPLLALRMIKVAADDDLGVVRNVVRKRHGVDLDLDTLKDLLGDDQALADLARQDRSLAETIRSFGFFKSADGQLFKKNKVADWAENVSEMDRKTFEQFHTPNELAREFNEEGELVAGGIYGKLQAYADEKDIIYRQASFTTQNNFENLAPQVGESVVLPKHFMTPNQASEYWTARSVKAMIHRQYEVFSKPPSGALLDIYDGFLAMFKFGATVGQVGVGFETRNMAGATANNIAAGVRTRLLAAGPQIALATARAAKEIAPNGKRYQDLLDAASEGKEVFRMKRAEIYDEQFEKAGLSFESLGISDEAIVDLKHDGVNVVSLGELMTALEDRNLFSSRTMDAVGMETERSILITRGDSRRLSADEAIKAKRYSDTLAGKVGTKSVSDPVTASERFLYRTKNNRTMSPDPVDGDWWQKAMAKKINANQHVETAARMSAMLEGIMRTGDLDYAADFTKSIHFDYSDLSDFEKNTMKRVVPFYTWMRNNIAFQFRTLFARPGKFQNSMDIHEAIAATLSDPMADTEGVPEWLGDRFGFLGAETGEDGARMGWRMESPKLDLYSAISVTNYFEDLIGSSSPVIKSALATTEAITGADLGVDYGPLAGKSFADYGLSEFFHFTGGIFPPFKQIGDDWVLNFALDTNGDGESGFRWATFLSKAGVPVTPISAKQQENAARGRKADRTRENTRYLEGRGYTVNNKTKAGRAAALSTLRMFRSED